ncbi:MAG TPA: hypothetical protein VLM85_29980 [Polyangiaceae bacterium]|nr:hypothetical protein [Polyangiaceae bacterium]
MSDQVLHERATDPTSTKIRMHADGENADVLATLRMELLELRASNDPAIDLGNDTERCTLRARRLRKRCIQ